IWLAQRQFEPAGASSTRRPHEWLGTSPQLSLQRDSNRSAGLAIAKNRSLRPGAGGRLIVSDRARLALRFGVPAVSSQVRNHECLASSASWIDRGTDGVLTRELDRTPAGRTAFDG